MQDIPNLSPKEKAKKRLNKLVEEYLINLKWQLENEFGKVIVRNTDLNVFYEWIRLLAQESFQIGVDAINEERLKDAQSTTQIMLSATLAGMELAEKKSASEE